MGEIISKEEFDELMGIKGETRGNGPKNVGEFVFRKEGENGLQLLEETITKLGYPIKYKEIKPMNYYPLGLTGISLLVAKLLFNFGEKEFQGIGASDVKFSAIQKIFIRYYVSLRRVIREAPKMWKKYHTSGNLKIMEFDEKKKNIILKLENFELKGPHCQLLEGYFMAVFELTTRGKAFCEETKCPAKGDAYHEFLVKW